MLISQKAMFLIYVLILFNYLIVRNYQTSINLYNFKECIPLLRNETPREDIITLTFTLSN